MYFISLLIADYHVVWFYFVGGGGVVVVVFVLHVAQIVLCHFQTSQLFVLLNITNKLRLLHVSAEQLT